MTTILRLEPPLPVTTPRGRGLAILFRDYGAEHHDLWTVVLEPDGAIWTFQNPDVRVRANETFGRSSVEEYAIPKLGDPGWRLYQEDRPDRDYLGPLWVTRIGETPVRHTSWQNLPSDLDLHGLWWKPAAD